MSKSPRIFVNCLSRLGYILTGCIMIAFLSPGNAYALTWQTQPNLASSSSFLPVGSGARAMGMGGAFIAIADDATAASWNPAGLIQLKRPQISLVGNLFTRQDHSDFNADPGASVSHKHTQSHINYFSVACPFHFFQRNMIVSLNYQHLYDMDIQYRRTWHYQQSNGQDLVITWDYLKKGGLGTISPALAIQIAPSFTLGATMNFWPSKIGSWDNGWKQDLYMNQREPLDENMTLQTICQKNDRYIISGTNFHFGLRWQINPIFTLGGVMKTSFSADLEHESWEFSKVGQISSGQSSTYDYDTQKDKDEEILVMPPSYGLGLAIRFSDALTASLDFYRTEWGKHKLKTDEGTFSPVTEAPLDSSSVKSTDHLRLGLEYLVIKRQAIVPLRFGLFYDPDPAENHLDDFFGLSIGSGLTVRPLSIDFTYQFRFARDISTVSFQGETDHSDINQHLVYVSVIYYL